MTENIDLAKRLFDHCLIQGEFHLRSGQVAREYFDKYLFESEPLLLKEVCERLVSAVPSDVEVLAGLEMGAIPITAVLSIATGLPACYVRKEPKTHGTAKLAEGADVHNKRTLIVEDVITTGGQVAISAPQLRELGAKVDQALCVVDRSSGSVPALDAIGVNVVSLFTFEQLRQSSAR